MEVTKDKSFVFDDTINEPLWERFVLVLEFEDDTSHGVTFQSGMDVLIIGIRDNDGM